MKFYTSLGFIFCINFLIINAYCQCPVPSGCTYTATNGVNYTVNAGEVLCINSPTNYNSGTITLNGGTVYVASGATLTRDISPTSPSTINICGTLSGTRRFNSNTTMNYYGTSNFTYDYTNGGIINNFSNNVSVSLTNISSSTPACSFTNYGTTVNLAVSNWNNVLNLTNTAGAVMTVTSSPTVYSNSSITNSGTLNWSPQLIMNSGATFTNNPGATFNATSSSIANFNGATFNNNGTSNFTTGPVFQSNSTLNNNGTLNSLNGKLDITGGSTVNNNGSITAACSTGGCTSIIIQGGAVVNNNVGGSITSTSGLFDTTGSPTIHNNGSITAYDIRLNAGTTLNLYNNSIITVTNRITTLDVPIANPSGCAYIDLRTVTFNGCSNQNLTNSSNVNVCGQIPYCDGATKTITNATNASPIVVTSAAHGLANGAKIVITGVVGNTATNQYYTVANVTANTFELVGSTGNGAYVSGGVIHLNVKIGSATYLGNSGCTNPCPPVLPLNWLSFTGVKNGQTNQLNWSTNQEKNVSHFIILKSTNGIDFTPIGIVNGTNPATMQNYQFQDKATGGAVYYQLVAVDHNQTKTYSTIVKINDNTNINLVVFPNPSDGRNLTLQFNAPVDIHDIRIYTVLGQEIKYHTIALSQSLTTNIPFDNSLATGTYIGSVRFADEIKIFKFEVR